MGIPGTGVAPSSSVLAPNLYLKLVIFLGTPSIVTGTKTD